jgi:hypothetical protein
MSRQQPGNEKPWESPVRRLTLAHLYGYDDRWQNSAGEFSFEAVVAQWRGLHRRTGKLAAQN